MKEYIVRRMEEPGKITQEEWSTVPALSIQGFPWDKDNKGYRPVTEVRLFYTASHFYIHFKVNEGEPKITYYQMNEPVYKDSCVEFFFNPEPEKDKRYLNFEMNAAGTLLLGIGEVRTNRVHSKDLDLKIFRVETSGDNQSFWSVAYSIPYDFIRKHYPEFNVWPGKIIRANFYKCGDDTKVPHYGCWNPIHYSKPDYHRPEYFGKLVLE